MSYEYGLYSEPKEHKPAPGSHPSDPHGTVIARYWCDGGWPVSGGHVSLVERLGKEYCVSKGTWRGFGAGEATPGPAVPQHPSLAAAAGSHVWRARGRRRMLGVTLLLGLGLGWLVARR